IVFPFLAVSGLFCSSLERQRDKTSRSGERDGTEPEEGGRARVAARCVPNAFTFFVWRDTGASAQATARAAPERRPPGGCGSGAKTRSLPWLEAAASANSLRFFL